MDDNLGLAISEGCFILHFSILRGSFSLPCTKSGFKIALCLYYAKRTLFKEILCKFSSHWKIDNSLLKD